MGKMHRSKGVCEKKGREEATETYQMEQGEHPSASARGAEAVPLMGRKGCEQENEGVLPSSSINTSPLLTCSASVNI